MFQRFPFIRFAFFFALGIVCRHYLGEIILLPFSVLGFVFLSYLFLHYKDSLRFQSLLAILSFLLLFNLGAYRLDIFLTSQSRRPAIDYTSYKARLISEPEERKNSTRAVLEIYEVLIDTVWESYSARVNAYFDKSKGEMLDYGDLVFVNKSPEPTKPPSNPGEFDYRNYLSYQNIRYQQFIGANFSVIGHQAPNLLVEQSIHIRNYCVKQLSQYVENPQARAVVLALVLGVKDELDNELIQSFSATGAMHVLAVSGLHVGIIYAIVFGLLKYLRLHKRKYRWMMAIISISVLWIYALLTGLSPSVLRAVTMFSFVALGRALFRKGNIYNTLSLSALALLLYNPYLIMSVGFQLSFLAVFGIVYLHPKIYGLLSVDNWLVDKVWSITCVSIAAQLATGPLSMLYFHQFPTYFLVSNLFIIPAAFAILIGGLLLLSVSWVPFLAVVVGWLLSHLVSFVNSLVGFVSRLPHSTVDGIYFSILDTWLIYTLLFMVILYFVFRKKIYLKFGLVFALLFSISQIIHFKPFTNSTEFSVLNVSGQTVMDFRLGYMGKLWASNGFLVDAESQKFNLHGKRLLAGVEQNIQEDRLNLQSERLGFGELVVFDGRSILWINKPIKNLNQLGELNFDLIVISNNAIQSLDDLIGKFSAENIILDKSNSFYTQRNLSKEAEESKIDIHQVATNGYFSSLWKK